ncbi:BEN domain-containing protein 5-like isoform X2 [Dermacentor albipictus]|uniref:BEN domain-containing protein 5-like isoform X2 n=1 Tax=Dermacentor albipictus TaxID=60249 RepID=UPI0038FC1294
MALKKNMTCCLKKLLTWKKIAAQEEELVELRALNRGLQQELLKKFTEGDNGTVPKSRPSSHGSISVTAALLAPAEDNMQVDTPDACTPVQSAAQLRAEELGASMIDIGQGLRVPTETWRRIQAREKDSLFVKYLLVAVWDPAQLQGRSLQGKHCPRFPDRPRKEPLTPWKVSVMQACFKRRLEKQGFPESVVSTLVKRMNYYVGEKIADIDRTAKRL